jgi:hypothetical protein
VRRYFLLPHAERVDFSAVVAFILVADVQIDLQDSRGVHECRLVTLVRSDDLGIHP